MRIGGGVLALLLAAGCSRETTTAPQAPAAPVTDVPAPSAIGTVVDGLTGKTAVEAGKRARTQLDQVSRQEKHAIDEVMP